MSESDNVKLRTCQHCGSMLDHGGPCPYRNGIENPINNAPGWVKEYVVFVWLFLIVLAIGYAMTR